MALRTFFATHRLWYDEIGYEVMVDWLDGGKAYTRKEWHSNATTTAWRIDGEDRWHFHGELVTPTVIALQKRER